MICIDTNILIYAHRAGAAEHAAARKAIESAASCGQDWGFALTTATEFWAQVTHPCNPGGASTATQARDFLNSLATTGGARVFLPGTRFLADLTELAKTLHVSGPRIFDVQIALTALQAGATRIWTHDANFVRVPGLRIEDPLN